MTDVNFYSSALFASDAPSSADEFPTRSHERVACSLAEIICSSDGGRAIGLEGTWGSGKSTVIDLALNHFIKRNESDKVKHAVFVFDAWAHQGDPLRRVFLEELISNLSGTAIDGPRWRDELEKLQSKRKKTTETRAEKLSWVARTALLTLPLYPAAYGLIAAQFKAEGQQTITLPILGGVPLYWLAFGSFALICAPYVVALATKLLWMRDPAKKHKSVIWAFTKQTDHVTTEQFIREDEATSIEFNAHFDQLVNDAEKRNYRLVIVLDNLDRLANDRIRDIWATMRNFFAAAPGSSRLSTLKNVWLVVPIDRRHIEAVFADSDSAASTAQASGDQITKGFIEKTFEIVLRVPPPLLSNWRTFLEKTLRACFGEKITEAEVYRLFRLFEIYQTLHPAIITPRAVKAYANKIVAQARLSGNYIPIEYQALFVLYKDEIATDIGKLQDSSLLPPAMAAAVSSSDWAKYLAAAHFNAYPDDALEILLSPEIEKALLEKNTERLDELRKTSGFDAVLQNLVASKSSLWATENPTGYLETAGVLDHITDADTAVSSSIWRDFMLASQQMRTAIQPSPLVGVGVEAIVRRSGGLLLYRDVLRQSLSLSRTDIPDATSTKAGEAWFKLVEIFAQSVARYVPEDEVKLAVGEMPIQGDITYLLGVIAGISNSETLTLSDFRIAQSPDEISVALVNLVQAPDVQNDLDRLVEVMRTVPGVVSWPTVRDAILARLQTKTPAIDATDAFILFKILRSICKGEKKPGTTLSAISADGTIHGLISLAQEDEHADLLSASIFELILQKGSALAGPAEHPYYGSLSAINKFLLQLQTTPSDFDEVIQGVANLVLTENKFAEILKLALPSDKDRELFRALFRRIVESPAEKKNILRDVIGNFDRIDEIVGPDLRTKLLTTLDQFDIKTELSDGYWRHVTNSFIDANRKAFTKNSRTLTKVISTELSQLSTEEWTKILDGESNELALVFELINLNELGTLEISFVDAMKHCVDEIIDGSFFPKKFLDKWPLLPGALSYSQRAPFYKFVRDTLINKAPKPELIARVFSAFGDELAANSNLKDRMEDVIRNIIEPLVADGTEIGITSLKRNARAFNDVIRSASKEDRGFVLERFNAVIVGADKQCQVDLRQVATQLGLEVELPKDDDTSSAEEETP